MNVIEQAEKLMENQHLDIDEVVIYYDLQIK